MNKIDEIFSKYRGHFKDSDNEFEGDFIDKEDFRTAVLEFAKHILEEASENSEVEMIDSCNDHSTSWGTCQNCGSYSVVKIPTELVNKESITSTLNKYL